MKSKNTTRLIFAIIALFVFAAQIFFRTNSLKNFINVSRAEDVENENDEEGERPAKNSSVIKYETVRIKLPDKIITTTKEIPRYDSDGDGLYDDEDSHPSINEFIIVKDNDRNGIDDRYER